MKLLYKIVIFFTVFYMMVLVVNSMNIFPEQFFSSDENAQLSNLQNKGIMGVIDVLFVPAENRYISEAGAIAIAVCILAVGAIASLAPSGSPIYGPVIIVAYLFANMLLKSYQFFEKLFRNWDVASMTYLGVAIGAALMVLAMITVIEMVAQGRSGE